MPGVCPNCVKLVPEGESCPDCKGPLIPVSQWAREKEHFLASRPLPPEASLRTAAPEPDHSPVPGVREPAAPGPRHYGLRFFLGALASIGAMVATVFLVFKIRGG